MSSEGQQDLTNTDQSTEHTRQETQISVSSSSVPSQPSGSNEIKHTSLGSLSAQFEAGGLVSQRYELESLIGAGGMGKVYLANDVKLNRRLVIKTILPSDDLKTEDRKKQRFFREAQSMAQMIHPNIATLFDFGFDESFQSYFMAIEYIEGETFKSYLRKKGGYLTLNDFSRLFGQVLSGLYAAHQKNIIHRDLKLDNLMVTSAGQVKILDFGLAKNTSSNSLTSDSEILGSVRYMPPEQITGGVQDERTDIYALGVIAFNLLSGTFPFEADGDIPYLYITLQEPPKPLAKVIKNRDFPLELVQLIDQCLEKDPNLRPQSIEDLMKFFPESSSAITGLHLDSRLKISGDQTQRWNKLSYGLMALLCLSSISIGLFLGIYMIAAPIYEKQISKFKNELVIKDLLMTSHPQDALAQLKQMTDFSYQSLSSPILIKQIEILHDLAQTFAEVQSFNQDFSHDTKQWREHITRWESQLSAAQKLWPESPQVQFIQSKFPAHLLIKTDSNQNIESQLKVNGQELVLHDQKLTVQAYSQIRWRVFLEATRKWGRHQSIDYTYTLSPGSLFTMNLEQMPTKKSKKQSMSAKTKSSKSEKQAIPILSID